MRLAVVTGGGGGIGAATVARLRQGGYQVAVFDILSAPRPAEGDSGVAYHVVDVREPDSVTTALAAAEAQFGPVDVLVNNAGIISEFSLLDLPKEEFERIMSVNVTGVFVCTQVCARSMVANGTPGRIVNLGSINSLSISTANLAHYAASKGAVLMLTKAAALEFAPFGIRVNAVGPGIVATPLVQAVLDDPARREHFIRRIPRGEITTTADVAETIFTLASPDLKAITGQLILVDGGELIGGARVDL
jgi:glucose 1-dehydrogenase